MEAATPLPIPPPTEPSLDESRASCIEAIRVYVTVAHEQGGQLGVMKAMGDLLRDVQAMQ